MTQTSRNPANAHVLDGTAALARRVAARMIPLDPVRLAPLVWSSIRPDAEAALSGGDQTTMREWHALLLDVRSTLAGTAPAVADEIASLARELFLTASSARRNPPEEALRRPASRRLLRTIDEMGGRDCAAADIRERMGVGVTNLSNIARPLVTNGLLTRGQDPDDARNARFSLTELGRHALHRDARSRPDRFDERVHVVETALSVARYETRIVRETSRVAGARFEPCV